MKNLLVLFAGLLLAVSLVFPNGFTLPEKTPAVTGPTDPAIVKILSAATPADKARIDGMYSGLANVVRRDKANLITTTERWALVQANTLDEAVEEVGKYPGLDKAIDDVFVSALGTRDVLSVDDSVKQKLENACLIIANSARVK